MATNPTVPDAPDDLVRDLLEALRFEVRYDKRAHRACYRAVVRGDSVETVRNDAGNLIVLDDARAARAGEQAATSKEGRFFQGHGTDVLRAPGGAHNTSVQSEPAAAGLEIVIVMEGECSSSQESLDASRSSRLSHFTRGDGEQLPLPSAPAQPPPGRADLDELGLNYA